MFMIIYYMKPTRGAFRDYWIDAQGETLESMLLDSNAEKIDVMERPEIISKLPCLEGNHILELGAGIGRFTGFFGEKSARVVAVDFLGKSCEENRKRNGHLKNVEILCQDVTELSLPDGSFDLIFSNWLLMYLSDEEVLRFAKHCIKWLKPGGTLFFRESCFHRSGDSSRSFNPTEYRSPIQYFDIFCSSVVSEFCFRLVDHGIIAAYVLLKKNHNQFFWKFRKGRHLVDTDLCETPEIDEEQFTATLGMSSINGYVRKLVLFCGNYFDLQVIENNNDNRQFFTHVVAPRCRYGPPMTDCTKLINVSFDFFSAIESLQFLSRSFDVVIVKDILRLSVTDQLVLREKVRRWVHRDDDIKWRL